MKRKWIALILAVALLITMVPLFKGLTFAMQAEETHTLCISGQKVWENYEGVAKPEAISIAVFDANGQVSTDTKTISGQGDTWSFSNVCFTVPTLDVNTEYHLKEVGTTLQNNTSVGTPFNVTEARHCNYKSTPKPREDSSYTLSNDSNLIVIFKHAGGHYIWKATAWTTDEKAAFDGSAYNDPTFISGTINDMEFTFKGHRYRFSVSQRGPGYKIYFETWKSRWSNSHYGDWYSAKHEIETGSISCNTNYSASNVTLTNTYTAGGSEPVNITVKKIWNDGSDEGTRPESIQIQLLADGVEVEGQKINLTTSNALNDHANIWVGEFTGVSIDESKNYTVKEILPAESPYTSSTEFNEDEGFTITNTRTIDIMVTKIWEGGDVEGTTRPPVTIKLLDKNNDITHDFVESSISGGWTHTFTVPKYDDDGNEIKYEVEEVEIAGYTSKITKNAEGDFTITNKYGGDGGDGNDNGGEDPGPTQGPDPGPTPTTQPAEVPATETTTSEIVAGDEDEKTTPTTTQPSEVVAGDEDEVDVVPTGENYLYLVVAILFILSGAVVLVPAIKKVRVKK